MIANAIRLLSALAMMNLATLALAGDLNPPGAPASTPGPEPRIAINQENTPGDASAEFRITETGSYYLEDNIILGAVAKYGIVIEASNVTVDLSGFTLDGRELISLPRGRTQLAESLIGIVSSGEVRSVTVRNGVVRDWGRDGISLIGYIENPSIVESVQALENGRDGIVVTVGAVRDCVVSGNSSNGISGGALNITGCVATHNGSNGIRVSGSSGGIISQCLTMSNEGTGIHQSSGGGYLIESNACLRNAYHGISLCAGNRVFNNVCSNNGSNPGVEGAGIHLRCVRNQAEGNLVEGNEVGIYASADSDHVVVRNSAADNSVANYQGLSGNDFGPIGTAATATSPWANISH